MVLDASKLEIQLPLLLQLKSAGFPLIAALTMWDILPKHSLLDISTLGRLLNSPIVPVRGLIGDGVAELAKELEKLEDNNLKIKKIKDLGSSKIQSGFKPVQRHCPAVSY